MNAIRWIAAGSIGGLVGAFVWAAIVYFAHAEVGWIAWGIGFVVGICVRFSAGEEQEGAFPGGVAILISAASILFGKYLAAVMLLGGMSIDLPPPTAEDIKLMMANAGTEQYETWAAVPPDKKTEVEGRWNTMPDGLRSGILAPTASKQITAGDIFQESFSPYDILWFLLAAFTAYRLGSGTGTESDD
jgi:hypothetical protein